MSSAASQPHLKLVRGDQGADALWHESQRARLAVVKENRIAAHAPGIDPYDPRWVLAMQTQARLQGTTLTPERREQLLRSGKRLGLRPFESNLVIAIVQDRARTGLPASDPKPALSLIGGLPKPARRPRDLAWPKWLAAISAGAALAAVLIRWFSAS